MLLLLTVVILFLLVLQLIMFMVIIAEITDTKLNSQLFYAVAGCLVLGMVVLIAYLLR